MTEKKHHPKKPKAPEHHKRAPHAREEDNDDEDEQEEQEELVQEGLEAIYGDKEMDFTKLDRGPSRLTQILLSAVVVLGVVSATAWAGFFTYTRYFSPLEEETFTLEIDAPEELVSGEEVEIDIRYKNPTTVPIASLVLEIRLPDTFELAGTDPQPTDFDEFIWELGELSAGSDNVIQLSGRWFAETSSSTPIQVAASYRPANFNADFEAIETLYVTTLESVIDLSIDGPSEASPGEEVSYTFTAENTSEKDLSGLELQLDTPDGFYISSSDPALEDNLDPVWTIEALATGEPQTISITGSYASDQEGFQYLDATIGLANGDEFLAQTTAQSFTDLLGTDVSLQIVVNGQTDDVSIDPGDDLRISLSFHNRGEDTLEDVSLLLDFQSDDPMPIGWSDASLDGGTVTSSGIVWSAETIEEIPAGDKVTVHATFPTNSSIAADVVDRFPVVASASFGENDVRSSTIQITFNTEANFSAEARYYNEEGAPLGSGPLPPTVGETTTYRVIWTIDNTLHELDDITVSAVLAGDAEWSDLSSADLGSVTFDETSRTVTWSTSSMPTTVSSIEAQFAIEVTPDSSHVGTFIKLLSGSSLQTTDASTESSIQKTTTGLTTDLETDEFASGKGAVVE